MKTVWTHSGQFHLDELMAIAVYEEFGGICTVVRQDTPTPHDIAIDIGGIYDGVVNFDHHQDSRLPSACVLIGRDLIPSDIWKYLEKMFMHISDCDCGREGISPGSFNGVIRSFNILKGGFEKALMVTRMVLAAHIASAKKAIADVERWNKLERRYRIAVQDSREVILNWKSLASRDGIYFLVCPNSRGEGYHLITRDLVTISIPKEETQTFRHNSGFMASYPTKDDAIAHGKKLIKQKETPCV